MVELSGLAGLALFAVFLVAGMGLLVGLRRRQSWAGHRKPRRFDTNLVVIGAGSAGLVSAYIASAVRAKVTLVEKHKMGGDCLNTGCVPSKALIRAARAVHEARAAAELGINVGEPQVDFAQVMARVQGVIDRVAPHDSMERYTELGVECVPGEATILSPWEVRVGQRVLTTRNIIVASGASPMVPPIPGIEAVSYLTSDNLWQLEAQPRTLLILGGGPIGCELAQAFQRLGTAVTLVDMLPRLLPREDEDVSALVAAQFTAEGIRVLTSHKTIAFEKDGGRDVAILETVAGAKGAAGPGAVNLRLPFDKLLVAVGRRANTEGLGLEALGIATTPTGTIAVDKYLRTSTPTIYACGDVAGPYQFTHTAAHQAWYAAVNALFGTIKKFRVDYRVIPWVTFIDPEVARVGLSEDDARAQGVAYEVTRYDLADLDRAIADNAARGFVKVLTPPGRDRVLGAAIVGYHAGELLTEFVTAMRQGLGLNQILSTIHSYPTVSEANKFAAGNWKRAHVPRKWLRLAALLHRWKRG